MRKQRFRLIEWNMNGIYLTEWHFHQDYLELINEIQCDYIVDIELFEEFVPWWSQTSSLTVIINQAAKWFDVWCSLKNILQYRIQYIIGWIAIIRLWSLNGQSLPLDLFELNPTNKFPIDTYSRSIEWFDSNTKIFVFCILHQRWIIVMLCYSRVSFIPAHRIEPHVTIIWVRNAAGNLILIHNEYTARANTSK